MTRKTSHTDSQPANVDKYGERIKRGSIVRFNSFAVARVDRVSVGNFKPDIPGAKWHKCATVEVIHPGGDT